MPLFSCSDCGTYVFERKLQMQKHSTACVECCRKRARKYYATFKARFPEKYAESQRKAKQKYYQTHKGQMAIARTRLRAMGYENPSDTHAEAIVLKNALRRALGRRCRECSTKLMEGKNCSSSRRLVCNTCCAIKMAEQRGFEMSKKLKHRLYMREYSRKKAA